jgi:two-component system, NtrC family, sensor histidine kinase HydH
MGSVARFPARQIVRPQDVVWLALFSALALLSPMRSPDEVILLFLLAVFQVAEPRIPALGEGRGIVAAILIKLLLGYVLIGLTGGLTSSYYPILLVPVVSAATSFGVLGTLIFVLLACGSYLSFLAFVDWDRYLMLPEDLRQLALRLTFLGVVGYLTQTLAEANRKQARRYQELAEELAEANRNLQAAEAAYRRSERLAALGQLSAGLAHELRNPMGTIAASAEMLEGKVGGSDAVSTELAGFIRTEVHRANSLITRFLQFARPLQLQARPSDISEVIGRAIAQVERTPAGSNVSIYRNFSPDVPPFNFDPELIEVVFYNLLLNAAQATPAGGAVTVKTRAGAGEVEIAVIDRGAGIDPKHVESIFNPFFTTKPEGVGLGLAIVSKIIDEHGGRMAVESEPGKGSVFQVLLPASVGTSQAASERAAP